LSVKKEDGALPLNLRIEPLRREVDDRLMSLRSAISQLPVNDDLRGELMSLVRQIEVEISTAN
jgi:hypothetical protein